MRTLDEKKISELVARLCIQANRQLPEDVIRALEAAERAEPWPSAQQSLSLLRENLDAARQRCLPICQDTGFTCVFARLGQDLHILGNFYEAIQEGVRQGYQRGFLRKSVVSDPLRRINTDDNTPAAVHVELVPGDQLHITVLPKGFGSENMSRLAMLKPADGLEGVRRFVLETVRAAGANPCPPIVVGLGIGGTFDQVAALAKQALLLPLDQSNPDPFYAALEAELLREINQLGIGPQGFGGQITALGLRILTLPTHVAGLPVAVNISCHVCRRASGIL